ncbi:hypothetical protein CDD83_8245 [Cordyceps sp. RAO-2017]|nr:hypothetical protein CDD83_8245 [Cordyceps sp. RAO-2017]
MPGFKNKPQGPIFFWKEWDDYTGWLCQWYYHPFHDDEIPEILYYTAEHYMMYQKAKLFRDFEIADEILRDKSPRWAKYLGRRVRHFDETVWLAKREAIMLKGNMLKFSSPILPQLGAAGSSVQPPVEGSLRDMLLLTRDAELVEASPFDRVWGVGFRAEEAEVNRSQWGLNLLGKALMKVRRILREQREMM